MAKTAPPKKRSLSDDAGYIVGIAMLVVLFVNAGAGAVVVKVAEKGGVKADHGDYLAFTELYLSTFLLSLTLTVAIAGYATSRMYGSETHWAVPLVVVILGAFLTGLPIHAPTAMALHYNPRAWLVAMLVVALQTFAKYYGTAFFGGTVVGLAGGLLLTAVVHHHRAAADPATPAGAADTAGRPARPAGQPWAAEVTVLILVILGAAVLVTVSPSMAGAVVGPTASSSPRVPPVPRRTATFTKVTWGTLTPQKQAQYHLEIAFSGLRGENCHVSWRTVYLNDGSLAETSGTVWSDDRGSAQTSW